MLKKIALLVVLFALPLGAMAQKFAHMNSQEVIVVMPEYTKAQADLEAMSKKYSQEMERTRRVMTPTAAITIPTTVVASSFL